MAANNRLCAIAQYIYYVKYKTMESQTKTMLAYLLRGNFLTGLQAYNLCGTLDHRRRICDIEAMNIPVQREWVTLKSGKRVKKYWLEKEDILKIKRKLKL
jgi:hypothetical protein